MTKSRSTAPKAHRCVICSSPKGEMVPVQVFRAAGYFSSSGFRYRTADRQVTRFQHQACADAQVELDRLSRERRHAEELVDLETMTEAAIAAYPERAEELRAVQATCQARINDRYTKETK